MAYRKVVSLFFADFDFEEAFLVWFQLNARGTDLRETWTWKVMRAFGHRVAICWVLLAQIWPFSNLSQQHPKCRNTVVKRMQHVASNNVELTCCDRLAGALYKWPEAIPRTQSLIYEQVYYQLCFTWETRRPHTGYTIAPSTLRQQSLKSSIFATDYNGQKA